jgi:hypothetical protein
MAEWKRRLLGLGLPCLLAYSFDIGMTMHGQPAEYWSGEYSLTNEGSPFFRKLFMLHPMAAVAGEALWMSIILIGILLLPEVLAIILAIAIVFGHTGGGYTWLHYPIEPRWFQTAHGTLLVSALVLGIGVHWSLHAPRAIEPGRRLRPLVRWGLLAIATAIACYMYLVPQ